ncbi:MAG: hypothetical protein KBS89_03555 [Bacteroidales bacterium]|nr:hypothetical protein [Candidatus Egerieousia equi]
MKTTISKNNIHIEDSAEVSKDCFGAVFVKLSQDYPDCEIWNRSRRSLILEWSAHNFLYTLHIARSHTKDVDLNYPQKLWEKILYPIVGGIGWIFIQ